jgi:RNA polymerase sigma factor, sigma-70 family
VTDYHIIIRVVYERSFHRKRGEIRVNAKDVEHYLALYRNNVITTALCYVKKQSDAEDILQEVFFSLYTYSGSFNEDEHVKAWLIRCTVNKCKDLLRSHWRRFSAPLEAAGEQIYYDRHGDEMFDIIHKLGKNNRIVLYMHYYEGYSVEETAKILGISANAVSSRLKRGRKQLKKLIEDERNESKNGL